MKKITPIIISILLLKSSKAQTLYDSLSVLNLEHYASLPVDSILHAIPQSYNYIKIIGSTKNNNAMGLCIYYPNNLNIWIRPKNYFFMTRIDPNRIWNINLFKMEIAHYILVIAEEGSLCGQE